MIDILVWVELTAATLCLGRFGWTLGRVFTFPDGVKNYQIAAAACGTLTGIVNAIVLLWFNPHPLAGTVAAIVLYTASWLLYESAILATRSKQLSFAFSGDLPVHLLNQGPYRLMRHPFYASFLLAWVAGICATGQLLLVLPLVMMFCIYNGAANHEEAKFAASPQADAYARYRAVTGKYLPRLPGLSRLVRDA